MSLEKAADCLGGKEGRRLGIQKRNLYEKQNLHGPFRDVGPCSEGPSQMVQDLRSLIKNLSFIFKAIKNHLIVSSKETTGKDQT